jgi:hypothetical protein
MQTIPTHINVDGSGIKITPIKPTAWLMHFRAIGVENPKRAESINAIEYICKFSKGELYLLLEISKLVEEDNSLTLRPKSFDQAAWGRLKRAISLWIKKRLLVRIKREHYMVNPWFLIPAKDEQSNAMNRWKALVP